MEKGAHYMEEDAEWPWVPQLDLDLPADFTTGQRVLSVSEQWMVLASVGVPLRVSTNVSNDLMRLLEVVTFMRDGADGVCPHYTTSYRTMYYWFHPEELRVLYGEARLAALQRLQRPTAWSLVLQDDAGPHVRAAERFIAELRVTDPPGWVTLILHEPGNDEALPRVPLADFKVHYRHVWLTQGVKYRLPQLAVDSEARPQRLQTQRLLQAKLQYHDRVSVFDEATAEAQLELQAGLAELLETEQRAYAEHVRFKRHYQRFLLERQARAEADEDGDAAVEEGSGSGTTGQRRTTRLRVVPGLRLHEDASSPAGDVGRAAACRKVLAAWMTLRSSGACHPAEQRAALLRRLHARRACPDPLPALNPPSMPAATRPEAALGGAAAQRWVDSVSEMHAQRRRLGRTPTFGQMFAVLFGVWEEARQARAELDTAAGAEGRLDDESLDAAGFVAFVERFVQSGAAAAAAPGSRLPRWVSAELRYALALLHLVAPAASQPAGRVGVAEALSIPRGVLHLHESLSAGSHHAAGALATMREHGLFTRQHSKASMMLLLRSMQPSPTHLWRELLLRRRQSRPPRGGAAGAEVEAARLLRFEQFYAVDHSFSEVDDPFMTRQSVTTLVAVANENLHGGDEEPELEDVYREAEAESGGSSGEGRHTSRLKRRVLKASMLLSGFKGVRRDAQEAQCELLVVLRRLGYLCDLDLSAFYPTGASSRERGAATPLMTTLGGPLPTSCAEHETELLRVMGNGRHTLLTCPGGAVSPPRGRAFRIMVPNSEGLYDLLLQTLVSLSYTHLIHTHRYDLSHLYAALAVHLSLQVPRALVTDRAYVAARQLIAMAQRNSTDTDGPAHASFAKAVLAVAKGRADVSWVAEVVANELYVNGEEVTPTAERVQRVRRRLTSVADSPFVLTESLLLLAASRWAVLEPSSGSATAVSDVAQDVPAWTMEPFTLLHRLLSNAPPPPPPPPPPRRRADGAAAARTPGAASVDVHMLMILCLAAMKRWRADFPLVHTLDTASYSVRRTDPFVLSSFLLRARDEATGAPLVSIDRLRDMAFAASPHFLGDVPHLLPLVDDTVDSYAARLLRFAARHIHALEPLTELLRRGAYGTTNPLASTAAVVSTRRDSALDDAPPRKSRLRTLRKVKQQAMENADLHPLLFASDVHDYLNRSGWTSTAAALSAVYNAVLFPFTATTAETLISGMETHMQLVTSEAQERGAASPETAVSAFVDAFARDGALREFFLAGQLLSVALESGMPEGFSLLLLEVTDRGNRHLRPLAAHLAECVFGRHAPSVWTEHHLTAQWHREKEHTIGEAPLFALDTRTPFRYASVEGRQELFARVSRWNAAAALDGAGSDTGAAAAATTTTPERRAAVALDRLLWCAGFLVRRVHRQTGRLYPYAYEGAVFPAADLDCVAAVGRLLRSHGTLLLTGAGAAAERRRGELNSTLLLHDLSARLGNAYDLLEDAPKRRFPSSAADLDRAGTRKGKANAKGKEEEEEEEDNGSETDYAYVFERVSTQLVEPWNRLMTDYGEQVVGYGEGRFYNQRLHRVSGYRWGATLHYWWLRLRSFWPW